jgi:hypothetical protein
VTENPQPELPPGPILPLGKLLLALALPAAAVLACDAIRPEAGEPLWLRWLRVLADHPVRASLAAALFILAASPPAGAEPPARSS